MADVIEGESSSAVIPKVHLLPGLWSKRIRLRSLQPGDEGFLARLDSDEQVMRHIHGGPLKEQAALSWARLQVENAVRPRTWPRRWGKWIVHSRRNCQRLGWVELSKFSTRRRDYLSIGYQFDPEFWNQGYANEAVSTVIQYVFRRLRERYLFAYARPENAASLAILQKTGFQQLKRRVRDGGRRECVVLRQSRQDWCKRKRGAGS